MGNHSHGFTLVEVLVALCASTIAALGMALLLQQALAAQGRAEREQHALLLSAEMSAAIAANAAGASSYQRTASDAVPAAQPCALTATCDPAALAQSQLRDWLLRARTELPTRSGMATLSIVLTANTDGTRRVAIALAWPEPDGSQPALQSETWLAPAAV